MTFKEVETNGSSNVGGFEAGEIKPTRLRLIAHTPTEMDLAESDSSVPRDTPDGLALVASGHGTSAAVIAGLESIVGFPAGSIQRCEIDRGSVAADDREYVALKPIKDLLHREQIYRQLLAAADAVSALGALTLVAWLWHVNAKWAYALAPVFAVAAGKIQGLYDRDDMVIRKSTVAEWRQVLRTAVLTGIATYLAWYTVIANDTERGIRVFAVLTLGTFALTLPLRALARQLARKVTSNERCLVVGTPEHCGELASRLGRVAGVDLIGIVSNAEVDSSVSGLEELVDRLDVHRIVIGPHPAWRERATLKLIQSAKWIGVRVSLMPTVMTVVGATTAVDELDSMVLLGVPRFGLSRSSEMLKRSLDMVGACTALLLAWPLMLGVAIAVKFDTPGAVLFRQRRVGRNGEHFTMLKFRSMVEDADHMRAELRTLNQSSGLFKIADDPRVTRVGRIIRRTYLDELPQLLNVLRGEMSLVGPRPLIEAEDALLTGYDRHRSRLMPGITGPWQLRGPLDASLPELAKLDYMYASNWSVWADVDILLSTAARVLTRRGH